jgi:radical SAM superfamily enzyme YgiQ (UPF0313 family)
MTAHKIPVIPLALAETWEGAGFYALGVVQVYAMHWKNGLLKQKFDFRKIAAHGRDNLDRIQKEIESQHHPAVYLFSSFAWTHELNMEVARFIKKKNPSSLIIFGGPEVPRRKEAAQEFMRDYPQIDIGVLGEGEETLAAILEILLVDSEDFPLSERDFSSINGLICRDRIGGLCLTGGRAQIKDLDEIPSPYLNDIFEDSVYKQWVATETNRGCPFGCTYCDWGGATLSKVRKYSFERVREELEFLASKKVRRLFLADANFGALKRDLDIVDILAKTRSETGYPKLLITNYAKNATLRVAYVVKKLYEYNIIDRAIISFQTLDQQTLDNVDRGNIKTKEFENLMRIYKENNIPMTSDLLLGLPGQTLETLRSDLGYLFKHMIMPTVYLVRVLTNAPMADPEYKRRFNIHLNIDGDVISTSSFSAEDRQDMISFNLANIVFVQEGFFKYIFYHIQVEHKINSTEIIMKILEVCREDNAAYVWIFEFVTRMINIKNDNIKNYLHPQWKKDKSKLVLDNLDKLYEEFYVFMECEYQVVISRGEKDSLIALQLSLMQKPHRVLPDTKNVSHDVVSYFLQLRKYISLDDIGCEFKMLGCFGAGQVVTPKQFIKKYPYNYARSPARNCPEWPLFVEGLVLQPSMLHDENLPMHYVSMTPADELEVVA